MLLGNSAATFAVQPTRMYVWFRLVGLSGILHHHQPFFYGWADVKFPQVLLGLEPKRRHDLRGSIRPAHLPALAKPPLFTSAFEPLFPHSRKPFFRDFSPKRPPKTHSAFPNSWIWKTWNHYRIRVFCFSPKRAFLKTLCHGTNPSIVFGAKFTIVCWSGSTAAVPRVNSYLPEQQNKEKSLFFGVFLHVYRKRPWRNCFRQGLQFLCG